MCFEMIFWKGYNIQNWTFENFVRFCNTFTQKSKSSIIKYYKNPIVNTT